jgi:hypothetical protein
MPKWDRTRREEIAADVAELAELERLLAGLPEELVIAYALRSGRASAAQYRLRMFASLRAMKGLIEEIGEMPVSVGRAKLMNALGRWREHRAKIAERLGG